MPKVLVLTSVHQPFDTRVFHKEARTLAAHGYDVTLVAPVDRAETAVHGVRILGLPRARRRWQRIGLWWRILRIALRVRAAIVHIHDPELLPLAVLLQALTRRPVVYDAHEWYADKMLLRGWIPARLRPLARRMVLALEPFLARRLAAVVTADHLTTAELERRGVRNVVTLYNYPLADICDPPSFERFREGSDAGPRLVYVGVVGEDRGIWPMLEAMACLSQELGLDAHLDILGDVRVASLEPRIRQRVADLGLGDCVHLAGYVPHEQLRDHLPKAHFGFLACRPELCALNIPTKMFEYMAAGLPVVATRANTTSFFLDQVPAGVLIDSQDGRAYAAEIARLWRDRAALEAMARAGRRAFEERYNWDTESVKLLALYMRLLAEWPTAEHGR
ncbi:MAG: glycosyltransferase family 4 protein [Chloroflexota bacterium]